MGDSPKDQYVPKDVSTLYMAASENLIEPWILERKRSVFKDGEVQITRHDLLPIFPEEAESWIGLLQKALEEWRALELRKSVRQSTVIVNDHKPRNHRMENTFARQRPEASLELAGVRLVPRPKQIANRARKQAFPESAVSAEKRSRNATCNAPSIDCAKEPSLRISTADEGEEIASFFASLESSRSEPVEDANDYLDLDAWLQDWQMATDPTEAQKEHFSN